MDSPKELEQLSYTKNQVIDLLKGSIGRCDANNKFPGAQPVSFQQEHLETIQDKQTLVCEKTDGVRFFLVETVTHFFFLVDRMNEIKQVFVLNCEGYLN